ncbi:unnamed protein product, partial [marine sediment metagenome]
PYNLLVVGDETGGWQQTSAEMGYQFQGGFNAWIKFTPKVDTVQARMTGEYYYERSGWTGPQCDILGVCQFSVPLSNMGWQQIDSTKDAVMTKDTQYTFQVSLTGSDLIWVRKLHIESVVP